jgi:hypothetical protein
MIPKSGCRFSEKIMRQDKSTIPKSGCRFSEKITRQDKSMIPKKAVPDPIGGWIPVFTKKDHAPGR